MSKTLIEIRDYLEAQPQNTWCKAARNSRDGCHCALGHIDMLLGGVHRSDTLLSKLVYDGFQCTVIGVNDNAQGNPKPAVIELFNKIINQANGTTNNNNTATGTSLFS